MASLAGLSGSSQACSSAFVYLDDSNQPTLREFLDGVAAAAGAGEPGWPTRFLGELETLVAAVEPRLAAILEILGEDSLTLGEMQLQGGEDARKTLLAINRLGKWRNRYDKPSPIRLEGDVLSVSLWYRKRGEE